VFWHFNKVFIHPNHRFKRQLLAQIVMCHKALAYAQSLHIYRFNHKQNRDLWWLTELSPLPVPALGDIIRITSLLGEQVRTKDSCATQSSAL